MAPISLTEQLNNIVPLSIALVSELERISGAESLRAKQVFALNGAQQTGLWFLRDGWLHRYYFNEKGDPVSTGFYGPGDLILLMSPLDGTSKEYLEALRPCLITTLNLGSAESLFAIFPEARSLALRLLRSELASTTSWAHLLHLSAPERYQRLRQTRPALFRTIPLRMIASYLNMSRENLSRLIGRDR